jgi:acetyl esterase/lipase
MKRIAVALLVCSIGAPLWAQAPAAPPAAAQGRGAGRGGGFNAEPQTLRLWEGAAPGAQGTEDADIPTIQVFRAGGQASGTAVVIAPGGAYRILSMNSEGRQEAAWFNALGVTAFVLKYRLGPKYRHPIELGDAQRAIRLVRARAAEFGVDPNRIGMMGFSAGGHLTATTGTIYDAGKADAPDPIDRVSSRPDFLILAYPVISFQKDIAGADVLSANSNSGRSLLGDTPDPKLLDALSAELHVDAHTPPSFLFHTTDDAVVNVENSVAFYSALRKARVPAEMHIFASGPHGSGMALTHPANGVWTTLLANWMRGRGLLTRAQ